jgi:hypothetical protein
LRSREWHLALGTAAAVLGSGVVLGCSTGAPPAPPPRTALVGLGETCGDVQNVPSSIQAACNLDDAGAAGVDAGPPGPDVPGCVMLDVTTPAAGTGLSLGICTPTCFQGCPETYDCVSVNGNAAGAVQLCEQKCVTDKDCPAPFQLCVLAHCSFQPCTTSAGCSSGRCADGLCVTGDASTR